jgi:DNA polymerase-1
VDQVDKSLRKRAKAINFGLVYGKTAHGLAAELKVPVDEAQAFIDAYFEAYPGVQDYIERTREQAREDLMVWTVFGRRVHIPDMHNHLAINAPIQGSAADLMRRSMVRMPTALRQADLAAKMLLSVHDELIFEAPASEVGATAAVVKQVMETAGVSDIAFAVPIIVDANAGPTWADAH